MIKGFLPQCLWGTQQLKTLIYASCFPWTQAWSSVVWQEHFPPLAVSISWADAQPLQMFETKMPQVGHGGMARHNLQVKTVMVPLFFSVTITANVPRWSQMYPDDPPGSQDGRLKPRWKKHHRSCMGTFSRRFNVERQCYVNTQQRFFSSFCLMFSAYMCYNSFSFAFSEQWKFDGWRFREDQGEEWGWWVKWSEWTTEAATHRVPQPPGDTRLARKKSRNDSPLGSQHSVFSAFLSLAGSLILIRYLRMQKNWNHQLLLSHTLTWLIQSQFLSSHRNSQLFCWEVLWLLWNHLGGFRRQRLHTFSSSSSHRWPMACVVIGGGSCCESFHVGTWRTAWSRSQHLSRGPSCFFNFWSHARSMWMNAWYFRILNMESSWEGL